MAMAMSELRASKQEKKKKQFVNEFVSHCHLG
jgi:hypothetical protein